jgi:redox-sensing transcriptional repressor
MENPKKKKQKSVGGVPEPTIRRLPAYLNLIKSFLKEGKVTVSSSHIARELKVDSTQVTKDIAYTGITGKTRVGFDTQELIDAIEIFLGFRKTDQAFLVGAGKLGSALVGYTGFDVKGLQIIAAFDVDENVVGTEIDGVKVLHFDKLSNLAQRMHVSIGIITTPAAIAQEVTDIMVEAGIRGIWNFTPKNLKVPDHVVVENSSIYPNLAVLFNKMQKQE